ncbi:hypothetical protein IU501_21955 [Nocardia otitidiscaviarum]|uniref:hypothetical protein n=1 Tax=Nocardia otitidiscaviarum TaxID=1823 RepID=UPI000ADF5578|nr:hypothetical protein [Nocardia otitidiscaviarum]MBF6135657.1 hypothetical protein [Nocardia otitidiscaviarum]MBF6487475.1 hypothetical protein [Nocardia otitidiscaviarum]
MTESDAGSAVELRKLCAETVYEVCKLSATLSAEQRNMVGFEPTGELVDDGIEAVRRW